MNALHRLKVSGEVTVSYNASLTQDQKSLLVIEIIKHLMYHKGQIPLPFDQISNPKFDIYDETLRCQNKQSSAKHAKSLDDIATSLRNLFHNLSELIRQHTVHYVHLAFGSLANPKESYIVDLRLLETGKDSYLSTDFITRLLCRELVSEPSTVRGSPMSVTQLNVMALCSRDEFLTPVHWFTPKLSYKIPPRSVVFKINLNTNDCAIPQDNIESMEDGCTDSGFFWLQAPVSIKGIKPIEHAENSGLLD